MTPSTLNQGLAQTPAMGSTTGLWRPHASAASLPISTTSFHAISDSASRQQQDMFRPMPVLQRSLAQTPFPAYAHLDLSRPLCLQQPADSWGAMSSVAHQHAGHLSRPPSAAQQHIHDPSRPSRAVPQHSMNALAPGGIVQPHASDISRTSSSAQQHLWHLSRPPNTVQHQFAACERPLSAMPLDPTDAGRPSRTAQQQVWQMSRPSSPAVYHGLSKSGCLSTPHNPDICSSPVPQLAVTHPQLHHQHQQHPAFAPVQEVLGRQSSAEQQQAQLANLQPSSSTGDELCQVQ